ncbi:M35 family metallo-endopeptidase [Yoonia sp. 208BN28-4]|uniref:M35 family metallo-endopeptidase n=1 Tax=Yoonia sp. 208BN28-4 TaxID=3126505 RepID=UPI0030A46F57
MRLLGLIIALGLCVGTQAAAQTFASCTKAEQAIVGDALTGSKAIALRAAANVGNNDIYERWFGKFSLRNGELVRRNLKAVVTAIRTGQITAQCDNVGFDGCERDTYAWVYPDEPYLVHLCPNFFTLPTMTQLSPGDPKSENGTREGTMIHEISHFFRVAGTDDVCYSRQVCSDMAARDASDALINADSYQYFAEDVSHFFINDPTGLISVADQDGRP